MNSRSLKSDVISALAAVIGHGALWAVFFAGLLFLVPRAERTIRDFNMSVPALTVGVLNASRWAVDYYYLAPLVILPLLVLDGAVYLTLRRTLPSPVWSICWSVLMFLIALAAIGVL